MARAVNGEGLEEGHLEGTGGVAHVDGGPGGQDRPRRGEGSPEQLGQAVLGVPGDPQGPRRGVGHKVSLLRNRLNAMR